MRAHGARRHARRRRLAKAHNGAPTDLHGAHVPDHGRQLALHARPPRHQLLAVVLAQPLVLVLRRAHRRLRSHRDRHACDGARSVRAQGQPLAIVVGQACTGARAERAGHARQHRRAYRRAARERSEPLRPVQNPRRRRRLHARHVKKSERPRLAEATPGPCARLHLPNASQTPRTLRTRPPIQSTPAPHLELGAQRGERLRLAEAAGPLRLRRRQRLLPARKRGVPRPAPLVATTPTGTGPTREHAARILRRQARCSCRRRGPTSHDGLQSSPRAQQNCGR